MRLRPQMYFFSKFQNFAAALFNSNPLFGYANSGVWDFLQVSYIQFSTVSDLFFSSSSVPFDCLVSLFVSIGIETCIPQLLNVEFD